MIKYSIIAGAMLIAAPAVAQQAPISPEQTASTPGQTAPGTTMSPTADSMQSPAQTTPTDATAPQSAADKVAQAVETQFPSYDADGNGSLSKTEFGAWMASLRANDPAAKPGSAEMKKWTEQAFTQTDTDKSKSVTKAELQAFLVQGQG